MKYYLVRGSSSLSLPLQIFAFFSQDNFQGAYLSNLGYNTVVGVKQRACVQKAKSTKNS